MRTSASHCGASAAKSRCRQLKTARGQRGGEAGGFCDPQELGRANLAAHRMHPAQIADPGDETSGRKFMAADVAQTDVAVRNRLA